MPGEWNFRLLVFLELLGQSNSQSKHRECFVPPFKSVDLQKCKKVWKGHEQEMYLQGVSFESYWCLLVKGQWVKCWNFHDPCICSRNSHSGSNGGSDRTTKLETEVSSTERKKHSRNQGLFWIKLRQLIPCNTKRYQEQRALANVTAKSQFSKRKSGNDPSFGIIRHIA